MSGPAAVDAESKNKYSSLQSYPSQNGAGGIETLLAVVLKDLETRLAEWGVKVEEEKSALEKEWRALEDEKARIRARTKAVEESAREAASALAEANRLRQELERRLAVTPMDLNSEQLQSEWRKIDAEKVDMKRAAEELRTAFDRLADAQAAYEMLQ
jgi:hypothetical protein